MGPVVDAESGLQYLRARYDPATAQFLTKDPLVAITQESYAYAANNPLNLTDPSGLCPWCIPIVVGIIVGGGIDFGLQKLSNDSEGCGFFDGINWGSVGLSGGIGGATGGFGHWLKTGRVVAGASRAVLPKPSVSNSSLRNIFNDLYRGTTTSGRVGTGTTADAVRNKLATGLPTGGKFHLQKAQQYSNALRRGLKGTSK